MGAFPRPDSCNVGVSLFHLVRGLPAICAHRMNIFSPPVRRLVGVVVEGWPATPLGPLPPLPLPRVLCEFERGRRLPMRLSNLPWADLPTRVASRDSSMRLSTAAAPASRTWVSGSGSPPSGTPGHPPAASAAEFVPRLRAIAILASQPCDRPLVAASEGPLPTCVPALPAFPEGWPS